jgi:beta-lactamase class A
VRNRNANIFLRGTAIFLLIIAIVLVIFSLVSYSRQRNNYPSGMTVGGVPVGGLDPQAASQRLLQIYNTPIEIQYNGGVIQADPNLLGFQLDVESMLAAADLTRTGGAFWGGFWDYLWNRDPTPTPVPLRATIAEDRLRAYLQTQIAPRYDEPSVPAQPIAGTPNFTPGQPGQTLDIDRAVPLVEAALQSPSTRVVALTAKQGSVARPTIDNLQILLKQITTTSGFDGLIGLYMIDLQNGQQIHFALNQGHEISVNPDVAFTAASTIKIPILVSFFIKNGTAPIDDATNTDILRMIKLSSNDQSDAFMASLNPDTGPLVVSDNMKKIGLENTFIAGYYKLGSPLLQRFSTPANQRTDVSTEPDPYNQTTPSDMGMLLEDMYQCAQTGGGALVAAFPDKINQDVCKQMINYLTQDNIGVLIQGDLPGGTVIAHKHGWVTDPGTGLDHDWSDAAIVYTPGGNFVLTIYSFHPVQLVFDPINKLFASLARAVYNYYNLSNQ